MGSEMCIRDSTDSDGLNDGDEINTHGSDPNAWDSSGDGLSDGFVVLAGFDPNTDYSNLLNARLTIDEVKDARIGSTMIEVSEGKANITMTLEETSDLSDWSNATTSETIIQVDAPAGARFYRLKMAK